MAKLNILPGVLALFLILYMGGVNGYSNDADGRLENIKDNVRIAIENQKTIIRPSMYFGRFDTNETSLHNWQKRGNDGTILQQGNFTEFISNASMRFTYNLTRADGIDYVEKREANWINLQNYTGISFWVKGDGSNNYMKGFFLLTNESSNASSTYYQLNAFYNTNKINDSYVEILNFTYWKKFYIDFDNLRDNTSNVLFPYSELNSTKGFRIPIHRGNNTINYSTIYIDEVEVVDYSKGSFDSANVINHTTLKADIRMQEVLPDMAYLYNSSIAGYSNNATILSSILMGLDFIVRNQKYHGAFTSNGQEVYYASAADTGFGCSAFLYAYTTLLNNPNSLINFSEYIYDNYLYNITNETRGAKLNKTFELCYNLTYNNITFAKPYANQVLANLVFVYNYYIFKNDPQILNIFNEQIDRFYVSTYNNTYGFVKEMASSSNIGMDGYESVSNYVLSELYRISGNSKILDILKSENSMFYHIVNATNYRYSIPNTSRGYDGGRLGAGSYQMLVYNISASNNLFNISQLAYNSMQYDDRIYGNKDSLVGSFYNGNYRISDYQLTNITNVINYNIRFPQNYSYFVYRLYNGTNIRKNNVLAQRSIKDRKGSEFVYITAFWDGAFYYNSTSNNFDVTGNFTDGLLFNTTTNTNISYYNIDSGYKYKKGTIISKSKITNNQANISLKPNSGVYIYD